jgi:hypothetical protein
MCLFPRESPSKDAPVDGTNIGVPERGVIGINGEIEEKRLVLTMFGND